MKKLFWNLLSIGLLFGAINSQAQEADSVNLFDLSLEDLLNMEITVASKNSEKSSDAPGFVTTYSAQDIENYGYYNLSDLASITSGYSNYTAFGEKMFETRGKKAGSWNNQKHLVLVDGIPMNHARAYSAPMENQLPVYFADRVEFMKGPGSALYGTSAFYGVVSVTPKSLEKEGTIAEGKFSAGNYHGETRFMANAVTKNEDGEALVSLGYYKRRFSGDYLGSTGAQNPSLRNWNDDNSIFINAAYKLNSTVLEGLKVGFIYMKRQSHMGDGWSGTLAPHNQQTWEEIIPYLKYNKTISKRLSFNSYFKYNNSAEIGQFPTGNQGTTNGFDFRFTNAEILAEIQYKINDKHSIIVGGNHDWRQQLGSPQTYDYTADSLGYYYGDQYEKSQAFNILSIYSQYQGKFDVLSGLTLTAGARLDNGFSETNNYTQLSPRVAAVQKLNKWINVKAMYGQALRTPGLREIVGNVEASANGVGASPIPSDLDAETISSLEAGFTLTPKHFNIAFVYFTNTTKSSLEGTSDPNYTDANGNPINYFMNSDNDITAQGVELDVAYAFNRNLKVFANYAIAKAYIKDTVDIDFVNVPSQKINAGVSYKLPIEKLPITISLINKNVTGYFVDERNYNTSEIDGFNFLDANIIVKPTKNIGLEFQVKNITDEQWYQPSVTSNPERDILYPGRTFLATLSLNI